jgi:hypothetical protein
MRCSWCVRGCRHAILDPLSFFHAATRESPLSREHAAMRRHLDEEIAPV